MELQNDYIPHFPTAVVHPPSISFTSLTDDLPQASVNHNRPLPNPYAPPTPPSSHQSPTRSIEKPWFSIPEATPLAPLTYGSDADVSCACSESKLEEAVDADNVSVSISELYRETRGHPPPENYLECRDKNSPTPQEAEDPLWYRPRDSIGDFNEVLPMPYETATKPPPSQPYEIAVNPPPSQPYEIAVKTTSSPQRPVRRQDIKEPMMTPRHSDVSHSSERPRGHSPGQSSNNSPKKDYSPELHRPTVSAQSEVLHRTSESPHPLQVPSPSHSLERTVSDKFPSHHHSPPHPHVHRRASESSYRSPLAGTSVGGASPTSHAHSHAPRVPSRVSIPSPQPPSRQSGSVGSSYHSNGPSVESCLDHVIKHADGSETVQSLV